MAPSIPKTMKALQLVEFKQKFKLNDVPVPSIGDNDLLVKVGAAGWCHTESVDLTIIFTACTLSDLSKLPSMGGRIRIKAPSDSLARTCGHN